MKRNCWYGFLVFLMALASLCPRGMLAQDVRYYDLVRQEFFSQATTNRAATGTAVAHDLFGAVAPAFDGSLDSVILSSPGGARGWSLFLTYDGTRFVTSSEPGETFHWLGPAPSGQYKFQVLTASGVSETFKAALPGPANTFAPLRVANLSEAQGVDAAQPFTLRWDRLRGTKVHDFISVEILATNGDQVFVGPRQSGFETNFTLDAGTLQPASNYNARVLLIHYFAFGTNHSPVQFIREERATRFQLKTLNPAGVFRFASSGFLTNEADGQATITVERRQGSEGDVTVDYFSSDGTAYDGTNYVAVSG